MQTTYLRFKDLKARGIVTDRMTLRRRIQNDGFPKAVQLGPNSIAWAENEVVAWLDARPKGPLPPKNKSLVLIAEAV